jgi:acetylornithine/N-succinyldiaminopimelate aminotransferase
MEIFVIMSAILSTYARADLAFERGLGSLLWTTSGRRYLDFGAGIAVNSLGHAHPHLVKALTEQANTLWHTSNLYKMPLGDKLAARLCDVTFADKVFFCNSGAEANEAAIKTARKYHFTKGNPERVDIITFEGCFHGRTLATLAATNNAKYLEGFGEKAAGFIQVPFGDRVELLKNIGATTAALMIEPIQGEGGLRVVPADMLRDLREICDKNGILLIFDEIQCGVGRTGLFLGSQHSGVTPDIATLAKAIGGGFPLGACLMTEEAGIGMVAGTHGSTFGGNPLAMAVGNAVMDIVLGDGFMQDVKRKAGLMRQRLAGVIAAHPDIISEQRGEGLMIGLKCVPLNGDVVTACRAQGLLTVPAGDNVVRFLPPLTLTDDEIIEGVDMLERACIAMKALK